MVDSEREWVIFSCPQYLIANKPAGLLSQKGRNPEEESLIDLVDKSHGKPHHLLTRLDRPVSGLAVLSSSKAFIKSYLEAQKQSAIKKTYLALVEGALDLDKREIINYAFHHRKLQKSIICQKEHPDCYKMLATFNTVLILDNYSLVEIGITGGKFHQIRAQLAHLGHPVKADLKYGARRRRGGPHIYLHSHTIQMHLDKTHSFEHQAPLPKNDDLWVLVSDKLKP